MTPEQIAEKYIVGIWPKDARDALIKAVNEPREQTLSEASKWIRIQMNGDDTSEYHAGYNDGLKAAAQLISPKPLQQILADALKHKDGQP